MQYDSKRISLKSTKCERDLGVHVDVDLVFSLHINKQVNKANQLLGLVRRSYTYLDAYSFKRLFTALIRPHLEYCGVVIHPRYIKDKRKIENVLRRASKMLLNLHHLTYEQHLNRINLPSMSYRFLRGDLIETYKWLHSYYKCENIFKIENRCYTRGHNFKLKKPFARLEVRRQFFTLRVVDRWNQLPYEIVNAPSLNQFKNSLDKHLKDEMYLYV